MFKIIPKDPNRIDIEISGKVDADGMKVALAELVKTCADVEHGRMLYRIRDFEFPSFGALAVELSQLPQLFKLVHKFDRIAVLADKEWVRKAGELEGKLFPGLEIKGFELHEQDEAERWLAG
jgi:hypothetical protein